MNKLHPMLAFHILLVVSQNPAGGHSEFRGILYKLARTGSKWKEGSRKEGHSAILGAAERFIRR